MRISAPPHSSGVSHGVPPPGAKVIRETMRDGSVNSDEPYGRGSRSEWTIGSNTQAKLMLLSPEP